MRGGRNFVELTGCKFGRLTVINRAEDYRYGDGRLRVRWNCKCDCGNTLIVMGNALTRKQTQSCGCYKNELLSARTWQGYEEISGVYWGRLKTDAVKRGVAWEISVEDAWRLFLFQGRQCPMSGQSLHFERNFKKNGKNQTASLDRIDSNLGYVIGNIQWVHKSINVLKWDWNIDELHDMCEKVLSKKESYTLFQKTLKFFWDKKELLYPLEKDNEQRQSW